MIPNQWYPIYDARLLKPGRPIAVRRLAQDLVLWRDLDGRAAALPDRCPHRAARLSRGSVRDGCIQCPYHGFRFNSRGECVLVPVEGPGAPIAKGLAAAPALLREEHGLIWLWYGDSAKAASEVPWLAPAPWENGSVFMTSFDIDVSYLRVIENMGDFFHLPFVHRRWFRGVGERLVNFDAHVEDDIVKLSGTLSHDARRRWQYDYRLSAELRLPAIARVQEAAKLHLLISATPIDRDRSWIWLRYSEGYVPRWLGGALLARGIAWFDINPVFKRGDVPTLKSQQLSDPGDISGYHLTHADRAIALYFGMRKRAFEAAGVQPHEHEHHALSAAGK